MGMGGGWNVWVAFDSADFPELEWALVEIERQKRIFGNRVLRVLGVLE